MPHVVLADDSPTIRKVVELSFVGSDFGFHSFADGHAALDYLRANPVDVLLADVSLPGIDGYQLCREVKSDASTAHIPVVLLTRHFEPLDLSLAQDVGYSTHLTKPFETSQLVGLVRRLMESSDRRFDRQTDKKETSTVNQKSLFTLTVEQCRPAPSLVRPLGFSGFEPITQPVFSVGMAEGVSDQPSAGARALAPQEVELVVAKVTERLQGEIRRLLSEALKDLPQ
jgi:CheY-like chemotaxis protein